MVVSDGLQKYFDASQKWKRDDTDRKLKAMERDIDPAFAISFQSFRSRILEIVDETPEASDMVMGELWDLDEKLKTSRRRHNLKKAAAILDSAA